MRPSNLTSIDFEEIRESIKSYMRTRPEFTDYDFTGSTLSYLVDVLAYNTYYSSFNANMALNELFLDTATLRDNVASIARMLNYLPRSAKAAWGCVTLNVQTNLNTTGNFPTHITLKKGQVATGNNNGQGFSFCILQDKVVEVDKTTGIATVGPFKVYEGDLLSYSYVVDTTIDQKFIIPNESVDIDTLSVYVKQNAQSTTVDKYSVVSNITNVTSTSRAFFVSEYEDRRYEITFGDGVIGKPLEDGNIVIFEYVVTNGPEGNNIKSMKYSGDIVDIDGNIITAGSVQFELNSKTQLGEKPETLKSIKFNAPRFYSAQNRAVTTKDYENIVKSIYPNARYVMATGGETLSPPIYGKVYISVKTRNNTKLNNLTKKQIIDDLRPYTMASIEVVVTDPDEVFIELNVLVVADLFQAAGSGTVTQTTPDNLALPAGSADVIKEKTLFAIKRFAALEDLGNFNKTLSTSKIQKEILQSDPAIVDVLLQVTVYKLLGYPTEDQRGQPMTWDVNFGIALDCSCSSSPGDVIKSSGFYTADRPQILQYLEDDGFGNLRQYYIENNTKVYTNAFAGLYDCDTGIVRVGPIIPVGEAEYIQLSVKPKNPANIAPGEVTGKLLARSGLRPNTTTFTAVGLPEGTFTSDGLGGSDTSSSGSSRPSVTTTFSADETNRSGVGTGGGDAISLTTQPTTVTRQTITDAPSTNTTSTTTSSSNTSSLISTQSQTPPGGVVINGATISTGGTVGAAGTLSAGGTITTGGNISTGGAVAAGGAVTIGGVTAVVGGNLAIGSSVVGGTGTNVGVSGNIAAGSAGIGTAGVVGGTAAAIGIGGVVGLGGGVAGGGALAVAGGLNVAGGVVLAPGNAGAPGAVLQIAPPQITVVPPGSVQIPNFNPGGIAVAPQAAINSVPPTLVIPQIQPAVSNIGTCFP